MVLLNVPRSWEDSIFNYWIPIYWKGLFYVDSNYIVRNHKYMDFCHPFTSIVTGSLEETKGMGWEWEFVFRSGLLCSYLSIPFSTSLSPMSLQTLQRHEAVLSLWASFQQSCQLPDFQSLVQHNPEDSNPKAERVDGDLEGNFFFFYHLPYFTFVLHNYSIRQIELLKFIYVPYIGSFCFYQYTLNF